MSCTVDKVIKVAKAEVGYLEKETKSNLDSKTANAGDENITKYARDLDKVTSFYNGRKQGCYWCDIFVDWCFYTAYGASNARKLLCQPSKSAGAGCKYSMQYYQNKGQFYKSPKVGDQIFFKNGEGAITHTGLVYKVSGSYVYTIEGNTSSAAGVVANGGCVAMKKYRIKYNRIAGYGRPAYDKTPAITTTTSDPAKYQCIHTVVKGNTLWSISTKYLGRGNRYEEIMELNDLTSEKIKVGQKLKIPMK